MAEYELVMVARAVKKGDGFAQAAKDVGGLNKKVKESGKEADGFGKKLTSSMKTGAVAVAGVTAAAFAMQKAFEFSREGAELGQLTESFELLNKNVLQTPDLLNDMRRAAGGTIKDTDLMAGVLTLAAGVTGEYAQTLANISPQLLEIARASNKLNPSLGDTAFLYESLTTAAKRQSVPIADNLGLIIKMDAAVKQVHPSLQNLAGSYEELTEQQKFLNELLFQGGNLIDQVGGDVNSQADAWARLTVRTGEWFDGVKQGTAGVILPLIELLSGDVAQGMEDTIEQIEDVNEAYEESGKGLSAFSQANERAVDRLLTSSSRIAGSSESYDDFIQQLEEAGIEMDNLYSAIANSGDLAMVGITAEEFYNLARAEEEMAQRAQEAAAADQKFAYYLEVSEAAARKNEEAINGLATGYEKGRQAFIDYRAEIAASIAAKEENARITAELAATEGDYFSQAIKAGDEQANLNQILYEAADAANADAHSLAALLSVSGEYTKEQINAALQTAATTAKAQELAQALVDGTITASEARDALAEFAQTWTATAEIETSAALSKLKDIRSQAEAFGSSVTRHRVVIEQSGSVPTGGSSGGTGKTNADKTGEADYDPNKKNYAQGTGGWLTVPPGYPNDSYSIGLSSNEAFAVVPSGAGMAAALSGGSGPAVGGSTYIDRRTTVINANTKEAAALAMATVAERRRERLDTYMGVG